MSEAILSRSSKFKAVREEMEKILMEELQGKVFSEHKIDALSNHLAKKIKAHSLSILGGNSACYKLICQVVIGENLGEHVRVCCKCMWDQERDKMVSEKFKNDTIFCVATLYATFLY